MLLNCTPESIGKHSPETHISSLLTSPDGRPGNWVRRRRGLEVQVECDAGVGVPVASDEVEFLRRHSGPAAGDSDLRARGVDLDGLVWAGWLDLFCGGGLTLGAADAIRGVGDVGLVESCEGQKGILYGGTDRRPRLTDDLGFDDVVTGLERARNNQAVSSLEATIIRVSRGRYTQMQSTPTLLAISLSTAQTPPLKPSWASLVHTAPSPLLDLGAINTGFHELLMCRYGNGFRK